MPRHFGDRDIISWLEDAADEAEHSTAMGIGGYRLGAVIVRQDRCWVAGFNSFKTHPILVDYYKYPVFHAEAHALIKMGIDKAKDATLFVARILKNGSWAMAQPCGSCQKLMEVAEIAQCYFTISDGTYGVLDV